jgi:hypothetical protein
MFDELDDPQGVPERDIAAVKAAASRQRTQRRALAGAIAVVALAVPIAAIAFTGDSDRPVETAARDSTTTSRTEQSTTTTTAVPAALDILETTTTTEPSTTSTTASSPRPTTTTTTSTTTTTTVPIHHDRAAEFEPWRPGVAGEAWADPSSPTAWRIGVTMRGLEAGARHVISVQEDTGSFSEIRFVCEFVAAGDGTGSCTGEHITEAGPPGQVSAAAGTPEAGYTTIAYAYFAPFPSG